MVIIEIPTKIEQVMVVTNLPHFDKLFRNTPPLLVEYFGYLERVKLIYAHGGGCLAHRAKLCVFLGYL